MANKKNNLLDKEYTYYHWGPLLFKTKIEPSDLRKLRKLCDEATEDWSENLEQVVSNINNLVGGKDMKGRGRLDNLITNLRKLDALDVTTEKLGDIRHRYLQEIPVSIWGQIVDKYTSKNVDYNGWELLNASTDLLWHKENPTVTTYGQNAAIVDGLCRAVA